MQVVCRSRKFACPFSCCRIISSSDLTLRWVSLGLCFDLSLTCRNGVVDARQEAIDVRLV